MNIYNERLIRLANHLEKGPLDMKWNFRTYGERYLFGEPCGCAISQLPAVFSEWKTTTTDLKFKFGVWPKFYTAPVRGEGWEETSVEKSAMEFFNLGAGQFMRLFIPNGYVGGRLGLHTVNSPNATKEQVAAEIRKFVAERVRQEGREELFAVANV